MPPWKPEPGWAAYRDERRLTPAQISLIQQWVDGGMPQGDAWNAPLVPQYTDAWQLGTPDLILEMPAAFSVPADGPDIYRNFVIPTNLAADKWVRAIELKPSARTVVHHSLFFSDTTGGARKQDGLDGQPGFPGFGSIFTVGDPLSALNGGLGGWVPGTTPAFLPQGIAMPLPKGSDFLLQTHFHPNGLPQTEKTVIGLYFGPAPARLMTQVQVPAFFGIRANIDIPAGETDYKVRGSFTLPADVDAGGAGGSLHLLGESERHRPGRGPESGRPDRQLRKESGCQGQLHFDLCHGRRPNESGRNRWPDRERRESAEAGARGAGVGGRQAGRSAIRGRGAGCGGGLVPGQCAHPVGCRQRRCPHRDPRRERQQSSGHDGGGEISEARTFQKFTNISACRLLTRAAPIGAATVRELRKNRWDRRNLAVTIDARKR